MGAALHLATVQQAPAGPVRKRGGRGGGGSDEFEYVVAKVYGDPKQTPESRELILLVAWLLCRDPNREVEVGEPKSVWERANEILGVDFTRRRAPRLADLMAADAPRYEMDYASSQGRVCRAPMIRRSGECGQSGVDSFTRTDPETGWRTLGWTCSRHRDWGTAQRRIERDRPRVEPIPNAGGLLPCYFTLPDDAWVRHYRWALAWKHKRDWEPPSYGLRADRWPTPGVEAPLIEEGEVPRLRLAAVDGELFGGGEA